MSAIPPDWHEQYLRRFMVGFHVPDVDQFDLPGTLSRFDPREFVRALKEAGVQVFSFYSKAGYGNCFWPSKVGHVHSLMGDRDFFGELTEACLSEGIVPSCVYEMVDSRISEEKPEWCHRGPEGKPQQPPCLHSPYREFTLAQYEEIMGNYPIYEFLMDMVDFPSSTLQWSCPYCEEKLRQHFGRDFPGEENLSDEEFIRFLRWRYAYIEDYLKEVRAVRDRLAPQAILDHNFHGDHGWLHANNLRATSEVTDAYMSDIFGLRDGLITDVWVPKLYRSHSPRRPIFLIDTAVVRGDLTTSRPMPYYLTQLASAVVNGAAYETSICLDHTGEFDRPMLETIRVVNWEIEAREPWIHGAEPVTYAGLIFPERSRDLIGGREQTIYNEELQGWAQLLVESHALFDIFADFKLAELDLSRYGMLILPDAICLTQAEATAVRNFVANGGILIATGETSLADENGSRAEEFALADVLGVSYQEGYDEARAYLLLDDPQIMDPDPTYTPWLMIKQGQVGVKTAGADALGVVGAKLRLRGAATPFRERTNQPALTWHSFGKGRAYYFASRLGRAYICDGYPGIRRMVERLLKPHLEADQSVLTMAPGCVYVEVLKQTSPERISVHLINAQSQITRSGCVEDRRKLPLAIPGEILPVPEVKVGVSEQFAGKVSKAYRVPGQKPLEMQRKDGRLWVTLNQVEAYEIAVFE